MDTLLLQSLFQEIDESPEGAISFARFMELALYHPDRGYYASIDRPVGRGGDFFTSVSVGEAFGWLLGFALEERWYQLGRPDCFSVVEQGAHDGQLASDILAGVERRNVQLGEALEYHIVEPLASRRACLSERLGDRVRIADSLDEVKRGLSFSGGERIGVYLSNELLDAFPVHRLKWNGEAWLEMGVARGEGEVLSWKEMPLVEDSQAAREAVKIERPERLEPGYETEVCPAVEAWARDVDALFDRGFGWAFDYGLEEGAYYREDRKEGTLRAYRDHQLVTEVLENPGQMDLTAHVNFTRVANHLEGRGMPCREVADQGRFLMQVARPWLQLIEESGAAPDECTQKRLRQFQTLTHPGMLGRVFGLLEWEYGVA